ncbi:TetR family transcriptional regulator [Nocardia tenerifensis]|uniref:TetR family transcriptional regulator n=1 Tax=Nocardia tenerifensis TaxID=228006 RepID=A0A318KDP8_9NOCA|nr:alpha/beta fold hydrolase [Nocardia tenerifensis]PXX71015.1 TetR family transcriptional regulator [Nocardia tenerifensis]
MAFVLGLRERKKLATREALAFAALRLAVERGVDEVLVEDIAAAAGVSPRTFNNYFASKYEAICSVAVDRARRIADNLRARPDSETLWPAVIHAALDEFRDAELPDPAWTAGVRLITGVPALQGEYHRAQAVMQAALADAIAGRTGRDLATDMFPRIMAGAVAAALQVALDRWVDADPPVSVLPVIREALRQLTFLPGVFPMDVPTQHTLAVPGAGLYYEIRGNGPLLLLITGGNGDAGAFDGLAERLADRYTVVAYDRRGFTRSPLDGAPHDRIVTDGADAAALITHLGDEPAYVLGSSSGAIVALELLGAHPELVRTAVAHEPPMATLLPDAATWLEFFDGIYRTSRTEGNLAAMAAFTAKIGMRRPDRQNIELPPESAPMIARIQQNLEFWMEHELRQYPRYTPDIEALRRCADKLVLAIGHDSKDTFPAQPNTVLAEHLGLEVVEFPGDHVGYVTEADTFAAQLDQLLRA